MIYEIFHWTEYRYSEAVPLSRHTLHMLPRDLPGQHVLSSSVEFVPQPQALQEHQDYFGNRVTAFMIAEPHVGMHIRCRSRIECEPRADTLPPLSPPWEEVQVAGQSGELELTAQDFLYPSPYVPYLEELRGWASESFPAGRPFLEGVLDLNTRIHEGFFFDKTATSVSTPLLEVFENRRGVCQDFAHLEIACLRALGLPARYMSGYLQTEPPPGQPKLFGGDASHAWVAVYCPLNGWVEVDPTNNRVAGSGYVTLGWGRDYGDVSLIRGVLSGGGDHSLYLSVNVEAVEDDHAEA